MKMAARWLALVPLCGLGACLAFAVGTPRTGSEFYGPAVLSSPQAPRGWGTGAGAPARGNCANVGRDFADNPFRGWPTSFEMGAWNTISAWWCDPNYFAGYTHWGIDVAKLVQNVVTPGNLVEYRQVSIFNAPVWSTAPTAVVLDADDSSREWNSGMGNYVRLKAVTCRCGWGALPVPEPDQTWVFAGHADCPPPATPTPPPGEPTATPESAYLLCTATPQGWTATYMHLKTVAVVAGQLVRRWDVLGRIDSTGNSTGDHLHYQINNRDDGAIDPAPAMCADYSASERGLPRGTRGLCTQPQP